MLWRPTYETRVLRDVALPRLAGRTLDGEEGDAPFEGAMLGAFDPLASAELGVWRRLLQEAFPAGRFPTIIVRSAWSERDRRAVAAATPPTRHPLTLLADDPEGAWSNLISPDRAERAFGAVVRDGVATLLMVGLPTEEAWDEFRALVEGSPAPRL